MLSIALIAIGHVDCRYMDFQLFLTLVAGHYLADFALQSSFMSESKKLIFLKPIGIHALTGHAFIHALVAGVVSGSFTVATIIGVTHWLIDMRASNWLSAKLGKKGDLFGIHLDQALHLAVILFTVLVVV